MALEPEGRRGHSRWDTEGGSMELALALQCVFCSGTVVVSRGMVPHMQEQGHKTLSVFLWAYPAACSFIFPFCLIIS